MKVDTALGVCLQKYLFFQVGAGRGGVQGSMPSGQAGREGLAIERTDLLHAAWALSKQPATGVEERRFSGGDSGSSRLL